MTHPCSHCSSPPQSPAIRPQPSSSAQPLSI
jgi:hypothetical protein